MERLSRLLDPEVLMVGQVTGVVIFLISLGVAFALLYFPHMRQLRV